MAISPTSAIAAYQNVASGAQGAAEGGFSAALQRAFEGVVETSRSAERGATEAVRGGGNITEVVTAVAKAELALQTTAAVRDRVVQAYQDIMRMPI